MRTDLLRIILSGDEKETVLEEVANTISHLVGVLFAATGLYFLITLAAFQKSFHHRIGGFVYGLSLLSLFTFSTIYHSAVLVVVDPSPYLMLQLRTLDYIAIYLVIAGTYTPLLLVNFIKNGASMKTGVLGLSCIWTCALSGVGSQLLLDKVPLWFSIGTYLFMGWFGAFIFPVVMRETPPPALFWLVAGGVMYSLGVIFLVWDSLHFNHCIWHFFGLTAATCHYITVVISLAAVPARPFPTNLSTLELLTQIFSLKNGHNE